MYGQWLSAPSLVPSQGMCSDEATVGVMLPGARFVTSQMVRSALRVAIRNSCPSAFTSKLCNAPLVS